LTKIFPVVYSLLGLLAAGQAWGQDQGRIAGKKKTLETAKGLKRAKILNQIAFEFRNSNPDSAIYFCKQSLSITEPANAKGLVAESYNFMGLAFAYKGKPKDAMRYYDEALEVATGTNDSLQIAYSYNNRGRLFFELADLTRAYDNFTKSQVIFESLHNKEGLSYIYRSLSDLFRSQHDYDNALDMALKTNEIRKELGEPRGIISSLNQLAGIYQLTGDYTKAEVALREAEELASSREDEASLAEIKLGLGQLYFNNGSLVNAKSEAFRADNIIKRLESPVLLSRSNLLLGKIFFKEKDFAKAVLFLEPARKQAELYSQLESLTEATFYLAQVYGLQGLSGKSSELEKKYIKLNDSLKNSELTSLVEKFNFQLEIEKNQRENEVLKVNEAKNQAQIRFQNLLNAGATLVVIIIAIFTYFLWKSGRARKAANQKLAIQNRQLVDLNSEKDSLMGIVAHDLRTPLSNIKNIADIVPGMGELNAKQTKYIGLIQASSHSGLDLISELLDVHSLESAKEPRYKSIELKAFLLEHHSYFNTTAVAKSITLQLQEAPELNFQTDPDWLGRSIDNLVSNAIKFSPKDSTVHINSGVTDDQLWIAIKDQGPGFSEEDKAKVFQKFKKLSARPTAGETSNGLGLSIVKTLVERLKGSVTLLSEKGTGSEFIIRLPLNNN
jgi:signal transduction histidine kinase